MRSRLTGALILAGLATALAGCGVSATSAPRALAPGEVPRQLRSPIPSSQPGQSTVGLYFVRDGKLALATRPVTQPASPNEQLKLLLSGPTDKELQLGFSSRISNVQQQGLKLIDGVAVVSLSGDIDKLSPLAYAQIVVTLDRPPATGGVRLQVDGRDLTVPGGESQVLQRPARSSDYTSLLPSPAPQRTDPAASPSA